MDFIFGKAKNKIRFDLESPRSFLWSCFQNGCSVDVFFPRVQKVPGWWIVFTPVFFR